MLFKYHLSADKSASSLGNGYRLLHYCTPSNDQVNMFGRSMIEMLGVLAIIAVLCGNAATVSVPAKKLI